MPDSLLLSRKCIVAFMALLMVASISACGDDDPVAVLTAPKRMMVVSPGEFDLLSTVGDFNTCGSISSYDGTYFVDIADGIFKMGSGWNGTWNAATSVARGETAHIRKSNGRGCTVSTWSSMTIKFTSEDAFAGQILFHRRVSGGECNTPCLTTYSIIGARKRVPE